MAKSQPRLPKSGPLMIWHETLLEGAVAERTLTLLPNAAFLPSFSIFVCPYPFAL
jgi:hypothetical protein